MCVFSNLEIPGEKVNGKETGQITLNYGPLNSKRRLDVRSKKMAFSSFH
jgi:hypothetical protein